MNQKPRIQELHPLVDYEAQSGICHHADTAQTAAFTPFGHCGAKFSATTPKLFPCESASAGSVECHPRPGSLPQDALHSDIPPASVLVESMGQTICNERKIPPCQEPSAVHCLLPLPLARLETLGPVAHKRRMLRMTPLTENAEAARTSLLAMEDTHFAMCTMQE